MNFRLFINLILLLILSACTYVIEVPPTSTTDQESGLTLDKLKNIQYQGIYEEIIQLEDGFYEGEPFIEGGASRPTVRFADVYAFGDINADGVEDAVILLVENSGGSGAFRYLAVIVNEGGTPHNIATIFVGDRSKEEKLSINPGQISLNMVQVGPNDPFCCASQKVLKTYTLEDNNLVELSTELLLSLEAQSTALTIIDGEPIIYQCDGEAQITARYFSLSDKSLHFVKVLMPDGNEHTLPNALSASGARYTDELQLIWWEKGGEAFAQARADNGDWETVYQDCQVLDSDN